MFGDITSSRYKILELGKLCQVSRGGSPRPINEFLTNAENGINWIKIGDANSETRYITKTAEKIRPEGKVKSRYVQPGDFILSNSMSFGRPYIMKIDGCIHDGWLLLKYDKTKLNEIFFYEYLSLPNVFKIMENMANGMVVSNLNSEIIKKLPIMLPPMLEQNKFADYVDHLDKLRFKLCIFDELFLHYFD